MVKTPGNHTDQEKWYIWTVRPGKFDVVSTYIKNNVEEVTEILFPTETSEKETKSGIKKIKVSPLYAGYVFLRYYHDAENPTVWVKINKHPFVSGYVGLCTEKDIDLIAK